MARVIVDGDIDVEGHLEAAVALGDRLAVRFASPAALSRLALIAARLPASRPPPADAVFPMLRRHGARHSLRRDRASVRAHYDLGNDFYSLWLDRSLTYSCAYFQTGAEDIDTAQAMKLDHLCRKLRLAPGERLLDVGCGWGALVRHAAQHYGARALGVTLSEPQAEWAQALIEEAGLVERCRVEVRDYREPLPDAPFDKIVSVGMFEHVGRDHLPEYFGRIFQLLKPGGVFLNHGIVEPPQAGGPSWHRRLLWRRGAFIDRYVFPDGELVPLSVALDTAETAGFEARDVETLREHYVLTLREWVRRLEQARSAIESVAGPRIYRIWRLYMSASGHAFASGRLNVAQILFGRQNSDGHVALPLTRGDLYRPAA
jgi:cyclopropane-fatty-acyl-phospholipid synthase